MEISHPESHDYLLLTYVYGRHCLINTCSKSVSAQDRVTTQEPVCPVHPCIHPPIHYVYSPPGTREHALLADYTVHREQKTSPHFSCWGKMYWSSNEGVWEWRSGLWLQCKCHVYGVNLWVWEGRNTNLWHGPSFVILELWGVMKVHISACIGEQFRDRVSVGTHQNTESLKHSWAYCNWCYCHGGHCFKKTHVPISWHHC